MFRYFVLFDYEIPSFDAVDQKQSCVLQFIHL